MPEVCYDPGKPTSYFYYLDYNSLYPSVMADFPLPMFGFRWMSEFEMERFDVMSIQADSNSGYILICIIKCPDDLHDHHDAYPMCPESTNRRCVPLHPRSGRLLQHDPSSGHKTLFHVARQVALRSPLTHPLVLHQTRASSDEGTQGSGLQSVILASRLRPIHDQEETRVH